MIGAAGDQLLESSVRDDIRWEDWLDDENDHVAKAENRSNVFGNLSAKIEDEYVRGSSQFPSNSFILFCTLVRGDLGKLVRGKQQANTAFVFC